MADDVVGADRELARIASRQDGVVTRAQALAAGITSDAIKHRVATGRLIRLHRGVYAVGHGALSDRGRIRAALLAAGPRAVASHLTAAFLHGLLAVLPAVIELTVRGRPGRARRGMKVRGSAVAPASCRVGGLPATTPLATLRDVDYPEAMTREALARGLVRPEQLPAEITAAPDPNRLQRRMHAVIRAAGLPQPVTEYRIGPYTVDFAWPDRRVIVETDGWGTHGYRAAFERDRARDAHLAALGYTVIRVTWRQLEERPMLVAARLAAVLARRDVAA